MSAPRYRFDGTVKRLDTYGERFTTSTHTSIIAATLDEATEKARVAFGANYDTFRRFWSHRFFVDTVTEVGPVSAAPCSEPSEEGTTDAE